MTRAAWLVALCACGDGIAAPDADVADADSDRGVVEVRLTTFDAFRPAAVYFQERDSTIALATHLDANGLARGYLRPHGFVTVVPQIIEGVTPFYTYANVSPGDELVIEPGLPIKGGAELLLRIPPVENTQTYLLETACGQRDVSDAAIGLFRVDLTGCGDRTDLLVLALTPLGDRYLYANNIDLAPTGQTPVTLTGEYRPFDAATLRVTNIPPGAERMFVEEGITMGKSAYHSVGAFLDTSMEAAMISTLLPAPPEATSLSTVDPDAPGSQHLIDWRPASSSITLDLGAVALREQTASAHYVENARSIVWEEAGPGSSPRVTIARMQWLAPQTVWQWTIVANRGDEARLDLPVLPRADLTPNPHSPPYDLYRVGVEGDAIQAIHELMGWTPTTRWPVEGETGTVVWQVLAQ